MSEGRDDLRELTLQEAWTRACKALYARGIVRQPDPGFSHFVGNNPKHKFLVLADGGGKLGQFHLSGRRAGQLDLYCETPPSPLQPAPDLAEIWEREKTAKEDAEDEKRASLQCDLWAILNSPADEGPTPIDEDSYAEFRKWTEDVKSSGFGLAWALEVVDERFIEIQPGDEDGNDAQNGANPDKVVNNCEQFSYRWNYGRLREILDEVFDRRGDIESNRRASEESPED
jgi:hypothetical protein